MRTTAIFGAKDIRFLKVYGVSARTREIKPVRTFCGLGVRGSQFFCDFVQTYFMDCS